MMRNNEPEFQHYQNRNGDFGSICINCFHAVCISDIEPLLVSFDSAHRCSNGETQQFQGLKLGEQRDQGFLQ